MALMDPNRQKGLRVKGHAFRGDGGTVLTDGFYEAGSMWSDRCQCGWMTADNWVSEKWARKAHADHKAAVLSERRREGAQ